MPALTANVRRAAERATLSLPFRVPPQEWFTLQQVGSTLGFKESTAEKLYDQGKLTGHSHNAGRGERKHKRVLRAAVIAYALKTADYTDESLCDLYCSPLPNFSREQLLKIAAEASRLAHAKA